MLNDREKKELKELAASPALKKDTQELLKNRHNPFFVNGRVMIDNFITFLTEYNYFMNHAKRPFHKIIDKDMRL